MSIKHRFVVKHNRIVDSILKKNDITYLEEKLIYATIYKMQAENMSLYEELETECSKIEKEACALAQNEEYKSVYANQKISELLMQRIKDSYSFNIHDLMQMLGVSRNNMSHFRQKIKNLQQSKIITWKESAIDENGQIVEQLNDTVFIPNATYLKNRVIITINKKLIPYLFMLSGEFNKYSLEIINRFSSVHTIRMYEIAIMIRKIQKNICYSIADLQDRFGTSYKEYADFRRRVIVSSIEEINEKSDITMDFREIKDGKKVAFIKFQIKQKKDEPEYEKPFTPAQFYACKQYFLRATKPNKIQNLLAYTKTVEKAIEKELFPDMSELLTMYEKNLAAFGKIKEALLMVNQENLYIDEEFLVIRNKKNIHPEFGDERLGDDFCECLEMLEKNYAIQNQTITFEPPKDKNAEIWQKIVGHLEYINLDGRHLITEENLQNFKNEIENRVKNNGEKAANYFRSPKQELIAELINSLQT